MSQLVLHSASFQRPLRGRETTPLAARAGRFLLLFTLTFLIGMISFFYLVKFTGLHTKGYELRRLEIERDRLVGLRQAAGMDIAQIRSLQEITGSAVAGRMIPMRSPIFVKEAGSVALLAP